MTNEAATAMCRQIISNALGLMVDEGVPGETIIREVMGIAITMAIEHPNAVDAADVIKLALALIGGQRGGPLGIATWCEELAASIRSDPSAPPPTTLN